MKGSPRSSMKTFPGCRVWCVCCGCGVRAISDKGISPLPNRGRQTCIHATYLDVAVDIAKALQEVHPLQQLPSHHLLPPPPRCSRRPPRPPQTTAGEHFHRRARRAFHRGLRHRVSRGCGGARVRLHGHARVHVSRDAPAGARGSGVPRPDGRHNPLRPQHGGRRPLGVWVGVDGGARAAPEPRPHLLKVQFGGHVPQRSHVPVRPLVRVHATREARVPDEGLVASRETFPGCRVWCVWCVCGCARDQ